MLLSIVAVLPTAHLGFMVIFFQFYININNTIKEEEKEYVKITKKKYVYPLNIQRQLFNYTQLFGR